MNLKNSKWSLIHVKDKGYAIKVEIPSFWGESQYVGRATYYCTLASIQFYVDFKTAFSQYPDKIWYQNDENFAKRLLICAYNHYFGDKLNEPFEYDTIYEHNPIVTQS